MTTRLLTGKQPADAITQEVAALIAHERSRDKGVPGLAVVLVGEDPASKIYVARKHKAALAAGMQSFEYRLDVESRTEDVMAVVAQLNADPRVHGILVQFPLPDQVDAERIIESIVPFKDVDGLTRASQGALMQNRIGLRPCTAVGIMDLLRHYGIAVTGQRAVVVGRSALVGLPVALLLMRENATVTIVHATTREPDRVAREADILVVAAGRANLVTRTWIKPGAVVVDVGINRTGDGLVGDVDVRDALGTASALTPVPGGVGPMTIAELMRNTWIAYRSQADS